MTSSSREDPSWRPTQQDSATDNDDDDIRDKSILSINNRIHNIKVIEQFTISRISVP